MKIQHLRWSLFPALTVLIIDQLSKVWLMLSPVGATGAFERMVLQKLGKVSLPAIQGWLFNLELHFNRGLFMGSFAGLPPSLRIISVSTFFTFIVFCYVLVSYFLKSPVRYLRIGMAIFLGGIAGNAIDRIWHGWVIDFISLRWTPTMIFNLADVFQWIGLALIVYSLFAYEKEIWFPQNTRGKVLINKKVQTHLALKFALVSVFLSFILGVFSYSFLKVSFQLSRQAYNSSILASFILSFMALSLTFAIVVFLVGLFISHRTAGPIYAFELYVEDLLEGKVRPFKLRKGDYYGHLEQVAQKLAKRLEKSKEDDDENTQVV